MVVSTINDMIMILKILLQLKNGSVDDMDLEFKGFEKPGFCRRIFIRNMYRMLVSLSIGVVYRSSHIHSFSGLRNKIYTLYWHLCTICDNLWFSVRNWVTVIKENICFIPGSVVDGNIELFQQTWNCYKTEHLCQRLKITFLMRSNFSGTCMFLVKISENWMPMMQPWRMTSFLFVFWFFSCDAWLIVRYLGARVTLQQ